MKQSPFKHIATVDFGTDEVIVRRLMLQLSGLTEPLGNKKDITGKMLSIYFNEIARKLLECRRIQIEISKYINEIMEKYSKHGLSAFITDGTLRTPSKPNLESIAANYLYTFKQVLKSEIQFVNLFYSTDIREARWDKMKTFLSSNGYKEKMIYKCIDFHYHWIEIVCEFRNGYEHTNRDDPFILKDFEVVNNSIVSPKWGNAKYGIMDIEDMCKRLINNMIHFGEEIFTLCLADFVLTDPFIIVEQRFVAEQESKENRFSISLNQETLKKFHGV